MLNRIIRFFLENRLVSLLLLTTLVGWGLVTAPFDWSLGPIPKDPVPVDAIPDLGDNQQIVFTAWPGRSARDIDDQITYPLTTYLLGMPGVKSIRSSSMLGFSSIYIIFDETTEFYWSRTRILEKLSSLPPDALPQDVKPSLGPDATALGQLYWYTLEGRDPEGNPAGGWDLHEIRKVQDYYLKYALNSTEGVSEVASVGGFVQEYQIDVNPDALKSYQVSLDQVVDAVRNSNRDVGAQTIEINKVEYLVRGLGYIEGLEDIENTVVAVTDNVPLRIRDLGVVSLGPAPRRGLLDKEGAEVVGGVVVARYGSNPMEVIRNLKAKINELQSGLPAKMLADGTESRLTIVPFYDRSELIAETLGTLEHALTLEILISILVIVVIIANLRASFLIAGLLPASVLIVFIAMRYIGVDANIVALSGIAIAIGTMVDLGIILAENIDRRIQEAQPEKSLLETICEASSEVSGAILTAVSTTLVSFLPVFSLQAAEGKLFVPLAFTKTFALLAALLVTLLILPTLAYIVLGWKPRNRRLTELLNAGLIAFGVLGLLKGYWGMGLWLLLFGSFHFLRRFLLRGARAELWYHRYLDHSNRFLVVLGAAVLLGRYWLPLGGEAGLVSNILFSSLWVGCVLFAFDQLHRNYSRMLRWCLEHKALFLALPAVLILLGLNIWLGFGTVFGGLSGGMEALGLDIRSTSPWQRMEAAFPGIGEEFMPSLDEGSFLLMPTSMPHGGMEYNREIVAQLDMRVAGVPEVDIAVGKLGRAETALDPAPISMFENVIQYKPEFVVDEQGRRLRFKTDDKGDFVLAGGGTMGQQEARERGIGRADLVPDRRGKYFRNWRPEIESADDIWDEIVRATRIPGITSAPRLQPIETRLIMLQTGMRAPMGIKVFGPDLRSIQEFSLRLEEVLKSIPSVKSEAVFAERVIGKPYLHLKIDRNRIGRYGLRVEDVQRTIETAIGGKIITSTVEGRERFPVRVRYPRELRDSPEAIAEIRVTTPQGASIPLEQLVDIEYEPGPQAIRSEDTFPVNYVLFDKRKGYSEVDAVRAAKQAIEERVETGELKVPSGVTFRFSGNFENQQRAQQRLSIVIPIVLSIVFLILYFQFRSVSTSLMVFSGVAMAFSGGFILLGIYGIDGLDEVRMLGTPLSTLFNVGPVNLSVAVWVGFIALFGIATDDGVLMGTYLDQNFRRLRPATLAEVREATIEAGLRRIRPAITTSATTLIALLPILSSTGKGSDIMVPMAIPAFGGMVFASVTYFMVPVLYCLREELKLKKS